MSIFSNIWHVLVSLYEMRHEPEGMRPLAQGYWRSLLSLAFFAIIGTIAFGAWEFYAVLGELSAASEAAQKKQKEVLDRKDLTELIAAYEARAAEFEVAKRSRMQIADPSR